MSSRRLIEFPESEIKEVKVGRIIQVKHGKKSEYRFQGHFPSHEERDVPYQNARIVFRILTSIVYLCTVVWFGFCIFGGFLVDRTDYETSVTTGKYLMIGFAVFFCTSFHS